MRISRDPDGQRAGVQRQRSDCLDFAKKCGWSVALVIEDNDRGAYSGKSRPGWDETMDQIESGSIDYLVAWANDRLTRHPRELEDLIDLLEATGTQVATVTSGNYDLATPEGRAHARIIGAIARQESERKSVRQKAANRHRAMSGQRVGGRRPFGYEQDGLTVRFHRRDILDPTGYKGTHPSRMGRHPTDRGTGYVDRPARSGRSRPARVGHPG